MAVALEDEVRHIQRVAVEEQSHQVSELGSFVAARFARVGLSATVLEPNASCR
jgi:hypothetical protein